MKITALLTVSALCLAGCVSPDAQARYDAIEAGQRAEVAARVKGWQDSKARFDAEHKAAIEADRKRVALAAAEAAPFCALSPVQRNAKVSADWEIEKDRPGSAYTSEQHMRWVMLRKTGC
jgi:alkylhydroperoxidase family enzyme